VFLTDAACMWASDVTGRAGRPNGRRLKHGSLDQATIWTDLGSYVFHDHRSVSPCGDEQRARAGAR
jgi:hypothetical protein